MEIKQDTIGDIIESESQMILHGAERFGDYFINASEFNNLLQQFIKSVDPDRLAPLPRGLPRGTLKEGQETLGFLI